MTDRITPEIDSTSTSSDQPSATLTDRWFTPIECSQLRWVRFGLGLITLLYFAASLTDVGTWLSNGKPASSANLANFFRSAELADEARWMLSPLFVWDAAFSGTGLSESTLVYRIYLLIGILLASLTCLATWSRRPSFPSIIEAPLQSTWLGVLLWIWFVGWANRIVLLAGLVEPILSVSLAAIAIAPLGPNSKTHWRAGFSRQLLRCQATLILLITTALMLSGAIWWNGMGAYALAAPSEDRVFDVVGSWFENSWAYELMTAWLVVSLPLGLFLAWRPAANVWKIHRLGGLQVKRIGIVLIGLWCILVGLLSANLLYAATLAVIATSLDQSQNTNGARKTD